MPKYRNPNGYGSVVRLSGNRRNAFVVRKTVGFDDRAFPIYEIVGYFPSRTAAMNALATYNVNPYDIDLSKSTFADIYEMFAKQVFPTLSYSLVNAHKASYKYCVPLYELQYKSINKFQMQQCIDDCDKSYATQMNIRNLLVQLDKFAYDMGVIMKMNSANLRISKERAPKQKNIFTNEEVQLLWQHVHEPCVDETLFLLYTGCRMSEMLSLECANVDLKENIMRGGIKTENGKNRVIPIHPKLRPIIEAHLSDSKYLFPIYQPKSNVAHPESPMKSAFNTSWKKNIRETLHLEHTSHECRHTFRSKLDSAGANKVAIDLIMGHKTADVGERVYTHKTLDELKTAIEKLSYEL